MARLAKQILLIILIIALFAAFNFSMYMLLTRRISDNFESGMVEVERYLPFEESAELARVDASLKLTENLPVLDGAAALVPVYAAFVDAVYPEGSVQYENGEFTPDSKMQYKNTVRGYKAIVDGDTDILFSAAPSAEQKAYAEAQGVELKYVPIGLEAFVFFVNEQNPVDGLTAEQIRDIYGGSITDWAQVGGANRAINPVTRIAGSGSQTAMEAFMADRPIARKSPLALFGGSIGYSFRYYLDGMVANKSVKMLALNGVYPSPENIRDRSYPIIAEFYAIYRADNENENIPVLLDWILSEEGQRIIEQSGYVGIR